MAVLLAYLFHITLKGVRMVLFIVLAVVVVKDMPIWNKGVLNKV